MPEEIAMLAFTGILAGTILLSQFVRTWGRYLEKKALGGGASGDVAAMRGELEALRSSVDALRIQLGEVEERVDFAERLLARERPVDRLPEGGGVSHGG